MAVSAGLAYAVGDAVVVLDADLQDPPEVIANFLARWREGFEVVYGVRKRRKESRWKRIGYNVFYRLLAAISPTDMPLDAGDFCLMDRRVVDLLIAMPEQNRFVRGLRAWVGFQQTGIEYERAARAAGRPQYHLRELIRLATDGIFSFSTLPLRLATRAGFVISSLALLGAVFTFVQRIFADWFARFGLGPVPGFATIVIGIFFLGGIQLISLGIIGEYIGRIYDEVRHRPLWITREALGFNDSRPRPSVGPIVDRATGRVDPVVELPDEQGDS
jgi:dolichol-phosphate mannosyltransferase